jgi:hypothetical protein
MRILLMSGVMRIWLCKLILFLKINNASILRYEVSENMTIKAYILINKKSISEFPFLKKEEILTKTKQIDNRTSKENSIGKTNQEHQKVAKSQLDLVLREDMMNYF